MLLKAYLNPKTKPVPTPTDEQAQALQFKDNEIGRYRSALDLAREEVENLKIQVSELKSRNLELENQPAPTPAPALTLADDQIIVTIPPIMSAVLEKEKEVAKRKSGKDFSISDLLLNNFWESVVNGVSRPFQIWTKQELSRLATKIKEQQTPEANE